MSNNFNITKLHPKVFVYNQVFPNPGSYIEFIEKHSDSWEDWYIFGKIMGIPGIFRPKFETFPTREEWDDLRNEQEESLSPAREIAEEIFYQVTSDYVKQTNITIPNWVTRPPSMCRYTPEASVTDELIMHYHTDYQQDKPDEPGLKFGITCTMYLNDTYEGGEISFKIFDGDDFKVITYKPKAGDIIVFPSAPPYYHGVKKVTKDYKYFLRSFWYWDFPGTDEWLANQEKFGKEEWAKMERARQVEGFKAGAWIRD